MSDKVIVTNLTALKKKYGAAGVKEIHAAVKELIAADKARGLKTTLVALDDEPAMKKLKAPHVSDPADTRQNKEAVDGVYEALAPDYLMILGAVDVIPHQDLKNPLFTTDPNGDTDRFAYGDLPYACDAPYSQNIKDFTGPTRVLGRLPDLTGAQGSPKYLLGLLNTAARWKSSKRTEYQDYLAISAEAWLESTAESLTKIFNTSKGMQTTPKKGYKWKTDLINRRVHFINCHGGDTFPNFLGQSASLEDFPVSHMAEYVGLKGNVREGTVVAAECCYGAQLYDPSGADGGQMGICNVYLDKKAYAFFGSTTVAYGPARGNDQADLICQYFLQRVLAGASTGRAALEARQRFVEKASPLSPTNRKTLAQFNLYGDPSITPVEVSTSKKLAVGSKLTSLTTGAVSSGAAKGASAARAVKAAQEAGAIERAERRMTLRAKGAMLSQLQPEMSRLDDGPSGSVKSAMRKMMQQLDATPVEAISFKVESAPSQGGSLLGLFASGSAKTLAAKSPGTTAFHVMFGLRGASAQASSAKKGGAKAAGEDGGGKKKFSVRRLVVLEAKEVGGKIVSVTEAHTK